MLLLDKVIMSPWYGFMWIAKELHKAAEQEMAATADNLTHELSKLYMQLEMGRITEDEFDEAEARILEALDQLKAQEG